MLPVVLKDNQSFYEINLNLDILKDPSGQLTIDDVIQPKWASQFIKNEAKVPNFGFSKSSFWARVKVQNRTTNQKTWYLSQNYVLQDYVTLFKKVQGEWKAFKTGDKTHFKTKEIEDRGFVFEVKPTQNSLYFLK